jgi:hypothetical protein
LRGKLIKKNCKTKMVRNKKKSYFGRKDFFVGLSYDHSFISVFCWYMGEPFWSCNFFLSIYPSSYSILILYVFFPKKLFWLSRQTGSRNLMVPKTLPTIWHTYVKLVTKYQISAIDSCWEKYLERTDRGKTVFIIIALLPKSYFFQF